MLNVPGERIELTTRGFSCMFFLGFPKDRTISSSFFPRKECEVGR